jgi:CheY-like chemotaxis protein
MAHIIVVDDDSVLRGTILRILERGGHRVREAENGREGLRLVEDEVPDLVITDLLMPEKEGIETIMELRDRFPAVPIIAISGAGGPGEESPLVDAELFGANASLSKPFTVPALLDLVEEVLSESDGG